MTNLSGPTAGTTYIDLKNIRWIETDPGGVIARGKAADIDRERMEQEHKWELLEKSRRVIQETKPPVMRYNPRGYPQMQYFCKR